MEKKRAAPAIGWTKRKCLETGNSGRFRMMDGDTFCSPTTAVCFWAKNWLKRFFSHRCVHFPWKNDAKTSIRTNSDGMPVNEPQGSKRQPIRFYESDFTTVDG